MANVIRAAWDDLHAVIAGAHEQVFICTPYYTDEGLAHLLDHLQSPVELVFVTRLSPPDWARGVSDPEALAVLLELLQGEGRDASLVVHQRLHAKAYLGDRATGLLGSANLTGSGFTGNFEIMVRLDTDGARASVELIEDEIATDGRRLGVSLLRRWVDEHRDDVFAVRRQEDEEAGQLAEMQRALDRMLGYGGAPGPEERAVPEMDRFVQWLEANHVLPGARVLLDRHTNRTGQNLTGHFRQCYFGVAGFLRHRADMIDTLDNALDMLGEEDIYELDPELRRSWVQYLDNNAVEQGEGYDIAILRGILPPSVGGTREGGGGGISTLKRIFPLVARFVTEVEG